MSESATSVCVGTSDPNCLASGSGKDKTQGALREALIAGPGGPVDIDPRPAASPLCVPTSPGS